MRLSDFINIKYLSGAFAMAMAVFLPSCSTDDCEGNRSALPLAGFYDGSSPMEAVAIDSTQIIGDGVPGGASALSGYASGTSQTYLPLRVDSDTTVYLLFYRKKVFERLGLSDTVTFIYERVPRFVSSACGAMYDFRMKSITTTHTFLDSVSCPAGIITNANTENLKFYFKVSHDDDENNENQETEIL